MPKILIFLVTKVPLIMGNKYMGHTSIGNKGGDDVRGAEWAEWGAEAAKAKEGVVIGAK